MRPQERFAHAFGMQYSCSDKNIVRIQSVDDKFAFDHFFASMRSVRYPRPSQAQENLEIAGMSLNNTFSNSHSNSLSFVDQLEKSLEIKEEFESIELRVKRLLADFDDFDW